MMVALVIHTLVKHMKTDTARFCYFRYCPNLSRVIPYNLRSDRWCLSLRDAHRWEAVDVTLMSVCLFWIWGCFLCQVVIQSFPVQEASHYSQESRFLIAGHGCRLPDAGVMGSRVIIIQNTEPTSRRLYGLQTAAFKHPYQKKKNAFHSHLFWKTSLLHIVNPSSWRALYLCERFTDVVMLGKAQALTALRQVFTSQQLDCLNLPQSRGTQVADDCKTATSGTESMLLRVPWMQ